MSLVNFLSNYFHKRGETIQTHTMFTKNGVRPLSIKDEKITEFYELYIQDVNNGSLNCCVTEKIADRFPFFMDIDFDINWFTDPLFTKETVQNYIQSLKTIVHETLEKSYSTLLASKFVCVSRLFYKIHIHYPDIIVDKSVYKSLRKLILDDICQKFPELADKWNKILDPQVVGLRNGW